MRPEKSLAAPSRARVALRFIHKTLSPRTLIQIGAGVDDDDIRDVDLRDVGRARVRPQRHTPSMLARLALLCLNKTSGLNVAVCRFLQFIFCDAQPAGEALPRLWHAGPAVQARRIRMHHKFRQ